MNPLNPSCHPSGLPSAFSAANETTLPTVLTLAESGLSGARFADLARLQRQAVVAGDGSLLAWRSTAGAAGGVCWSPLRDSFGEAEQWLVSRLLADEERRWSADAASAARWPAGASAARRPHEHFVARTLGDRSRLVVELCADLLACDRVWLRQWLCCLAAAGTGVGVAMRTLTGDGLDECLQDVDWLRVECPRNPREPRHLRALETIADSAALAGTVAFVSGVVSADSLALLRAVGFAGACGPLVDASLARARRPRSTRAAPRAAGARA